MFIESTYPVNKSMNWINVTISLYVVLICLSILPYIDKKGGYSEKLAAQRLAFRGQNKTVKDSSDQIPACPKCGKPMVLRTAKTGKNAGKPFWGCSAYPDCKGVATV